MAKTLSKETIQKLETSSRGSKPTLSRLTAFCWADCPTGSLARAQRSADWVERAAIARHPKTPDSALKGLAEDTHPVVRVLAKHNLAERAP
jgi:hypothetical protein